MRKHDVNKINLQIDEVEMVCGGIVIYWSSDIGFGQYTIGRRTVDGNPDNAEWVGGDNRFTKKEPECMDKDNDKAFGAKLLSLWMEQIKIVE